MPLSLSRFPDHPNRSKLRGIHLKIKAITGAISNVLGKIKGLRDDIQPGYADNLRQVQADVRAIKERLGIR
jgi:hypothetical protein